MRFINYINNIFTIILLNLFKYNAGKSSSTAAVRANYPIPSQCILFYFEVDIVDKGKNGYISFFICYK